MRLTSVFLSFKRMPRGHIWRGKQRFVREVTPLDKDIMLQKLKVEEENLFYLRHPYLTVQQEDLFIKAHPPRDPELVKLEKRRATVKPNVTIEERLNHLRHTEGWD
ncbi:large ribosomal subunit protein mL63 [Neocloeon triangulifer]|uniref:large ribosomal subunit protein mL63 n=1 Tax=Neocloeon triangulifer TaxID=2078957 RepID=UPI00286EF159|nr:large ribosomal subunit protein mL63 [Neocloeon triangulifer]